MVKFILSCFWFFLPAYLTNILPPFLKRWKICERLNKPLDFNKKFLKKPILGAHKTIRGVVFGFLLGFFTVFFQKFLYQFQFIKEISFLNYSQAKIIFLAILLPLGAIFGDLLFSFIKRRIDLPPGAPFLPFDQTNYVIGAFVFLFKTPFFISFKVWISLFFLTFFLHLAFNYFGYLLKIHRAKF